MASTGMRVGGLVEIHLKDIQTVIWAQISHIRLQCMVTHQSTNTFHFVLQNVLMP